jgi:hypothetical protein
MAGMSALRWFAMALVVVTTVGGCTVDGVPETGPSGAASAPASGPGGGPPCPWSELRGQDYEPENGRVKLVHTCLAARDVHGSGGFLYRTPATANQADRYTDGVAVAVVCVEANGERYLDNGGHSSVVWFRVDGEFAGGEAQGWVPHAATGYAATTSKDPCSGVSASPGQSG